MMNILKYYLDFIFKSIKSKGYRMQTIFNELETVYIQAILKSNNNKNSLLSK